MSRMTPLERVSAIKLEWIRFAEPQLLEVVLDINKMGEGTLLAIESAEKELEAEIANKLNAIIDLIPASCIVGPREGKGIDVVLDAIKASVSKLVHEYAEETLAQRLRDREALEQGQKGLQFTPSVLPG